MCWYKGLTLLDLVMNWKIKAIVYKFFSTVPFGIAIYSYLRHNSLVKHGFDPSRRVGAVKEMMQLCQDSNTLVEGKVLLEVGSGWHPVLPCAFYGMGVKKIVMTDIAENMRASYVRDTVEFFLEHSEEFSEMLAVPNHVLRQRWQELLFEGEDWVSHWQTKGIEYLAPCSFQNLRGRFGEMDIVFSNSCLGYIPADSLAEIIDNSYQLLKAGGRVLHNITVYDDYTGIDNSITRINYLYYSNSAWEKRYNSKIHYQNRLRPYVYKGMFENAGFKLLDDQYIMGDSGENEIDTSDLDAEFRELPDKEISCLHYLISAHKPIQSDSRPCK